MNAHIRLTREPLEPAAADRLVAAPGVGGRVLFTGAVRETSRGRRVVGIFYEAYEPMARKLLEDLAGEARERYEVEGVVIHHRIGELQVGDLAVVIAVGAAHRQPAFDACRYLIDQLKQRVPIWKKETYEGGAVWVSPTP